MTAAAKPGGTGKPRKTARLTRAPGGRQNVVKVLLTDEEKVRIAARAKVAGVSVQRLMIEAALAGDEQTASERRGLVDEFTGARRLVAAIGRNLNQLTRAANATGELPPELSATMHATAQALARLNAATERLDGTGQ
ncbi:plasmid mobilization relaxosome protein MobC [Actinomadura sp. NPDC048394]|uniref:plasmid mobilization protein n=1 Tax=Actinomadura sp. NPDC048394 TaxID=3158223 RepID=UPI0033DF68F1